jgi:hypothetical protein
MLPMVMRLLGAAAPKTEEGMTLGHAKAAPAATAKLFKNSLRVTIFAFLALLLFIIFSYCSVAGYLKDCHAEPKAKHLALASEILRGVYPEQSEGLRMTLIIYLATEHYCSVTYDLRGRHSERSSVESRNLF